MLVLLPPSETKRDGGADGSSLDLARLAYPGLGRPRRAVLAAVRSLARNATTMSAALGLGPKQRFEVTRNRELRSSPTMPALDRYTGVLYDALGSETLDAGARAFAAEHVVIHSALFGLVGASDPIPAYRLSHDSRLPGLSLRSTWRAPAAAVLAGERGLIVDLRSEGYVELGPPPAGGSSVYVRVLSQGADGRMRALNHFNKKGKGEFARALLGAAVDHPSADSLLDWAASAGFRLSRGSEGELDLVV